MFCVKKNELLQLQVSNICHVNNIFITHCLSHMCCVNLAETSHTIGILLMFVLKIRLYEIIVCSCMNNKFFPIYILVYDHIYTIGTVHSAKD